MKKPKRDLYFGISFKLLISTALLILCSVFFVSYFSYTKYTKNFEEQSSNKVQQIIVLVSLNINTYLDDLFRLSLSPYYNNDVMEALDRKIDDSDLKTLDRTRTIENFLDEMMIIPRNDILRVLILNGTIYKSERIDTTIDDSQDYKNFQWYKDAMINKNPIFMPAHLEEMVKDPKNVVFSVVNVIKSTTDTDRILGVIKVDANYSGIQNICNKVNFGQNGGLFIIDENKNIIFSSIKNIPYNEFYQKAIKSKSSYTTYRFNNTNWLLNSTQIPRANWTIIAVNSLNEINSKSIETRNNGFILSFIFSTLAIFILVLFIKWFLSPLLVIVKEIRKIQDGNLVVSFPENRKDEIGYLGSSLNKMVENINVMMDENTQLDNEVYEAKFLQKEAQIKTLFNEIRPHFIYNTLNMISMLIQCDKPEKAVDNINKLSSILRGMSNWDKDIYIEQEVNLLDAYLSIQNSRYGDKLEYSIKIDKSLYSYVIPALILQPIVENAVIHNCETRRVKTIIKIWSAEEDNNIVFNITDNGEGMSVETLETLRNKIENYVDLKLETPNSKDRGSGIGLINVNRRLRIKYGDQFGLHIFSIINEGTNIKILIPKNTIIGGQH